MHPMDRPKLELSDYRLLYSKSSEIETLYYEYVKIKDLNIL